MSEPAAVVFDFGGVIITPITRQLGDLAASRDTTLDVMMQVIMGPEDRSTPDHPWHRLERGEIALDELQGLLAPFAEAAGLTFLGDEIVRLMAPGQYRINQPVLDEVARLRDHGHRTGLLTNSIREFHATLEAQVDLGLFDVVIDSSEVGLRKPEPAIYELVEQRLAGSGPIIYLDDFAPNLDEPRRRGWETVHVTDPDASGALTALARIVTA